MATVVLSYDYVDDILERRKPHREGHLAHVERFAAGGGLVVAGATGDPPTGALFVFEDDADPAATAESFVAGDPYVAAGLVVGFQSGPVVEILHHLGDGDWNCTPDCFAGYIAAVESAVRFVDTLSPGAPQ